MHDRQTRIILETLYEQSPKRALNLCNRILEKDTERNIKILSLKALVLLELNKLEESLEIAKVLLPGQPTDPFILEILDRIFIASGDAKKLVPFYLDAYKSNQTIELTKQCYFVFARNLLVRDLVSFAIRSYKIHSNHDTLWFLLASIDIYEGKHGADGTKLKERQKSFLDLALKNSAGLGREECSLALHIAFKLKEWEILLNIAEKYLKMLDGDEVLMTLTLAWEQQGYPADWQEKIIYLSKVRGRIDWQVLETFMIMSFKKKSDAQKEASVKYFGAEFLDRYTVLVADLFRSMQLKSADKISDSMETYLLNYSDRDFCIPDIEWVLSKEKNHSAELVGNLATNPDLFTAINNCPRLARFLVFKGLLEPKYDSSGTTEFFLDGYIKSHNENINHLLSATVACFSFLKVKKDCYSAKMAMVLFYVLLGCGRLAYSSFRELNIRNLQFFGLSYLMNGHLEFLGALSTAKEFYEACIQSQNEAISNCHSTWRRLVSESQYYSFIEFYELAYRLQNSNSFLASKSGLMRQKFMDCELSELFLFFSNFREELFDEIISCSLVDTFDYDILYASDYTGRLRDLVINTIPTFEIADAMAMIFLSTFCMLLCQSRPLGHLSKFSTVLTKTELWKKRDLELQLIQSLMALVGENISEEQFIKHLNEYLDYIIFHNFEFSLDVYLKGPHQFYFNMFRKCFLHRALVVIFACFFKTRTHNDSNPNFILFKEKITFESEKIVEHCDILCRALDEYSLPPLAHELSQGIVEDWMASIYEYKRIAQKTISMLF